MYEWSKEYVLQYTPKDKTYYDSVYDEERNLTVPKVAFMRLSSPGSEDFALLAAGYNPTAYAFLFNSSTCEWTKIYRHCWGYDVARFGERLYAVDKCRSTITVHPTTSKVSVEAICGEFFFEECLHKSFLIELYDKELMLVHILYNPFRDEDPTSQVNYFYCSKPNGERLCFSIFVWDTGLRWVSVKSFGEIVLFLKTCSRCTFYA